MARKLKTPPKSGLENAKKGVQPSPLLEGAGQALPFEAVIMAGGRGERLRPLTLETPKAMLKVGERPISEYLVRQLVKAGVKEITFCVNYLGEQVKAHFGDGEKWKANIGYIHENEPLGTIGGIRLKPQFKFEDLLIINGDLLTTIHFDRFFAFFIEEDADVAVASIPYRVNLPYGIFELGPQHEVKSVREKPIFNYYLNTGIYFIKRELTALIPADKPFDAIDLIEKCLESGRKVASYPLHDYWIDIGQMEDFQKAQEDIHFLDL